MNSAGYRISLYVTGVEFKFGKWITLLDFWSEEMFQPSLK